MIGLQSLPCHVSCQVLKDARRTAHLWPHAAQVRARKHPALVSLWKVKRGSMEEEVEKTLKRNAVPLKHLETTHYVMP